MLALAALAACSKDAAEGNGQVKGQDDFDAAYISVRVATPYTTNGTRSSSEQNASASETAIKSLYAITFDSKDNVIAYKDEPAVQVLANFADDGASAVQKPDAIKVSSNAKKILLIANPGEKLEAVLDDVATGDAFDLVNAAVTDVDVTEIMDAAKGFTMVNANGLISISNLCVVGEKEGQYKTDALAKAAAEGDDKRMPVNIERLTAKVMVKLAGTITVPTDPTTAKFTFGGWALDVVNGAFYPYAKKTDLNVAHTAGDYQKNFYTEDPNFTGTEGLIYNSLKADLTPDVTFMAADANTYCIENTMQADMQKHNRTTTVIIKGTYYPDETWSGDWFAYGSTNYKDFATLQAAYADVTKVNLRAACDKFYAKVVAAKPAITAENFSELDASDLTDIENAGEVVKEDSCIKWYKGGVNYYTYLIRHDNESTDDMSFGRYGVVRNNWYVLTLNSVKGAGTPWYPGNGGGGGDDDDDDDNDASLGYLGMEVTVNNWVYWQTGFGI